MIFFFLFLLIASIFLEGTMTTLPLVFLCLLLVTIFMRNLFLFILAFLAGIFLDAFVLRPIGEASIFLLFIVFLILLYQRKYEINSYPFVMIASFFGSLVFLLLFGYGHAIEQAIISAIIAVFLFIIFRLNIKQVASHGSTYDL